MDNEIAQAPPQPSPEAPPGLEEFAPTVLGWLAWLLGAAAVGALIYVAIMMILGRRNRSQMAADGLTGLPWIVGGLILGSSASAIASVFLS